MVELERFRVLDRDRLVGYLVLVELQRPGSPLRFYQVRTPGAGRVGRISLDGRFLRWEPFRDEPRDLGLFPMKQGLAHLFELDAPPIILPVEGRGQPTEASAHRLIEQALARPSPAPGSRPTRTPTRPR